jgi:hypothetical protein
VKAEASDANARTLHIRVEAVARPSPLGASLSPPPELRADADPRQLALAVFAALQGGLALSAMMESIEPLQAALHGALATLHASAGTRKGPRSTPSG